MFVKIVCLLGICVCMCQAEIYAIQFKSLLYYQEFEDIPASFGPKLTDGAAVKGLLVNAYPPSACNVTLKPPPNEENGIGRWILLVPRFTADANCTFEIKVRTAQSAGYDAVIIYNVNSDELVPMSANNTTGIYIPSVFVSQTSGLRLKRDYVDPDYFLVITGETPFNIQTHLLIPFAIVVGICFLVMMIFMIIKFVKDRRRQRRHRLPTSALNKIPTTKYQKSDPYEVCAICLDDYIEGEKLRVLPCNHAYHSKCIDPWLTKNKRVCPICKRKVFAHDEAHVDSDSDSDVDDRTPLINSTNRDQRGGGTFVQQTENPIQRAARSVSQQSGAANYVVTASDHHSINGDLQSTTTSSTTSGSEEELFRECDNLEVHIHNSDTISTDSNRDVHV